MTISRIQIKNYKKLWKRRYKKPKNSLYITKHDNITHSDKKEEGQSCGIGSKMTSMVRAELCHSHALGFQTIVSPTTDSTSSYWSTDPINLLYLFSRLFALT